MRPPQTNSSLKTENPRTTRILFEIFAHGFSQEAYQDLEALLDWMTPIAIATIWEPAVQKTICEVTRLKPNEDEGLLAEAEATAIKRILAYQIQKEMEERHLTKTALARLMNTSRSSLDRLLDPENPSVTLVTMENAAVALGKRLKVQLA